MINQITNDFNNHIVQFIWQTGLVEGEEEKLPSLANALTVYGTELEKIGLEPEIVLSAGDHQTLFLHTASIYNRLLVAAIWLTLVYWCSK